MAEVYKAARGMKLEKLMGHHQKVQHRLGTEGAKIASKARRILAQHRHDGHSYIETSTGDMDVWVTLNDERGQLAAHIIEYGRNEYETEDGRTVGAMRPIAPLRKAAGLYGEAL